MASVDQDQTAYSSSLIFDLHCLLGIITNASNFAFSHSVVYPFGELSTIYNKSEIVI